MLILTVLLVAVSGCATGRNWMSNQGSPFPPEGQQGTRELSRMEWLRDTLYDVTMPGRGKPDDYGQPIFVP
jgi:hypothetical protein